MPFTVENIYLGSGNPAFLTSTGAALYLNQQKLATESFVTGASGVLAGLISAASAGVSSLNGSSGVLNLLGAGNVTVTTAGQNITVSGNLSPFSGYVTGAFYTKNNESGFLASLSGLSTGYMTGISGELSNRLFTTGSTLATSGQSIDIKVNSLSGYSNATFATISNVQTTGINLTALINSTGSLLDNKINSLSGFSTGAFSAVKVTGSNILSIANLTGVGLGLNVTSSGQFIYFSGDSTILASVINLQQTGINLTATFNTSGQTVDSKINSLSGYSNATFATISNLFSSGSVLDNKINSLSGFTTGAHSSVRVTGSSVITGANFTGVGLGVTVTSSGQIIFISGDATILASVQNLFTTGSTLNTLIQTSGQAIDSRINSLSGTITNNLFSTGSNLQTQINVIKSAYVTGLQISGSAGITGAVIISGVGSVTVIQSGYNYILISGNAAAGEANTASSLSSGLSLFSSKVGVDLQFYSISGRTGIRAKREADNIIYFDFTGTSTISSPALTGSFVFRSGIQNGVNSQFINFPYDFSPNPRVIATLNNSITNVIIPFQISGILNTGFTAIFSNTIPNTGYSLDVMVISQDSGLAINSINNISNITGTILSISGSVGIVNIVTLSGINGISAIQSGNTILFSGASSGNLYDFTSTIGKPTYIEGRLFYDSGEKTIAYYPDATGVTLNIGQESWIRSINVSENLISNGQAIYISGSVSGLPAINLARADSESTSQCVGMTTMDIPNNSIGYVTAFGVIHGMNLSGIIPGTKMYLSQFVSGGLTGDAPSGLNFKTRVGFVTMSGTAGNLLVVPSTNTRGVVATPVASIIFDKNTGIYVAAPAVQNFNLIVDDLASKGTLALVDSIKGVSYVQDALWNKSVHNFWPNTTTTMNVLGATATSAGTISHPTTFTDLTGAGYTSNFVTAVGGGPAGIQSNFTPFFATSGVTGIGAGFFYTAQFTFPDLSGTYCTGHPNGLKTGIGTGIRFFAGMTDAASILLTQDSSYPTAALLGFQLTRSSGTSGVFDDFFNFTVKQNGASAQMYRQNTLCPFRAQENFSAYIYVPNDFRSGIFWELNNLTQNFNYTGMFTGNYGIFLPQVNAVTQTLLKPTLSFTAASGARNVKLKGMYCETL